MAEQKRQIVEDKLNQREFTMLLALGIERIGRLLDEVADGDPYAVKYAQVFSEVVGDPKLMKDKLEAIMAAIEKAAEAVSEPAFM